MMKYLALGDSYTIGEQVSEVENYPNQTAEILRKLYLLNVGTPRIIAQTGWTTDELMAAIQNQKPENNYDLVTLLIGVNNQYRGRSPEDYEKEFSRLLVKAISFAGSRSGRVFVLSIPDWGLTPFAKEKESRTISEEINAFNQVNQAIALAYQCHYLNITESSREHGNEEMYLTPDKLHYSGAEYKIWAEKLAGAVVKVIDK
jgi:lysophospholipase L1-like esterase